MANSSGDAYLLSTNLPGQELQPLITKFKDKIINSNGLRYIN